MIAEALQSALANDPGMIALLGTPGSRPDSTSGVFPELAIEQPTMPYLTMSQETGEPTSGELMTGTGALTSERWRFSCYGSTYKKAKTFAKYTRRFLLSLYGPQAGNVTVQSSACVMEADEAESIGKGTLYGTHCDFEFTYFDGDV